jgi:hypothetical protein
MKISRVLAALATTTLAAALFTGCGSPVTQPAATSSPTQTATKSATPSATATPTPTPTATKTGLTYSLSCTINLESRTAITDYKAAWTKPFDLCTVNTASGTPSAAEKAAGIASGGKSADTAKYLYGVCATTAGLYFEGSVSKPQAAEIRAALTLCPDHPKRAELEASANGGESLEADRTSGKLAYSGKYLVGKDIQPGTWQSQGDKVENCYWETSDAQGNIIANNFISISPQFTITIPASAAGFTVQGCGFRWINP